MFTGRLAAPCFVAEEVTGARRQSSYHRAPGLGIRPTCLTQSPPPAVAMPPPEPVTVRPFSALSLTVGIVTLLMTALAGGAVWSLLALSRGRDLSVLSLGVGVVQRAMQRKQGFGGRMWSALLAALLTALASVYAAYVTDTADVAIVLS